MFQCLITRVTINSDDEITIERLTMQLFKNKWRETFLSEKQIDCVLDISRE